MGGPEGHEAHKSHDAHVDGRLAYFGFAIAAAAGMFIFLICSCFYVRRRRPRGGNHSRQSYAGVDDVELSQLSSFPPSLGQSALPRAEVKLVTCEAVYVIQPEDEEGVRPCRATSTEDGPQKCVLGIKVILGPETVANASTREPPNPVAAANILSAETMISIITEPHPRR